MRQNFWFLMQVRLFVRPLIASVMLSALWYFCFFRYGICFRDADESGFTDAVIPILAAFHAIVAGFALNKVWTEYIIVQRCIKMQDKDGFLAIRDDRIPMPVHFLLGSIAFLIQGLVSMLHYEEVVAGIASTFAVSFVLVMYWEVAINLDNPRKAVWYVNKIPEDWFTDSIEEKHATSK